MMLWTLLLLYVGTAAALVPLGNRVGRRALWLGAVPSAVTAVWALDLLRTGRQPSASFTWVEGLGLTMGLQVDALGAVMTLLVAGIGALVFVYAAGYFGDGAADLGRFAATLTAFAAAMLGLVWADTVWSLFLFWELTSITSFLLVGHKDADAKARTAARRALVITVAGGLALLGGFVVLVDASGSVSLRDLGPVTGGGTAVAAVLVLVAAATKSAQVPFHVWLPGAMAAPTPVSAYLHSATMVKAGVLLVALVAPALGEVPVWTPLGLAFGLGSMLWGAIGALRQRDAKLILAWGTVSQLGLLIALLALDEPKATFAALAMLVAHAIFKAALFMVVGEVDVRTGTRDVTALAGLWRTMPLAFGVAVISGASMMGLPPLLGFPAKEAAIEAVLKLEGGDGALVAALVIGGSVLTVAYTLRFLVGTFGGSGAPTEVAPARPAMAVPSAVLAATSLAGFVALGVVSGAVADAATTLDVGAGAFDLLRWPGLTTALWTSVGITAAGTVLGVALSRRLAAGHAPAPLGADLADRSIDGVVRLARTIAATVQHGSLPVYVLVMVTTTVLAASPFLWSLDVDSLRWSDGWAQVLLALAVVVAALGVARVDSRLGAALALGAVGVGVAGLFVVQGAPDLALTQLLVETVVVVGFVIGLGHLTRRFPPVGRAWVGTRVVVSGLVGIAVAVGLAAAASAPTGAPPVAELTAQAVDEGGGDNVVNVILTDIRALDTLGEVMVLVVVAVGVLALGRAGRTERAEEAT